MRKRQQRVLALRERIQAQERLAALNQASTLAQTAAEEYQPLNTKLISGELFRIGETVVDWQQGHGCSKCPLLVPALPNLYQHTRSGHKSIFVPSTVRRASHSNILIYSPFANSYLSITCSSELIN